MSGGSSGGTALTGLVLAAGMSSRFLGKIKGLTPVGPHGETLLHLALAQLKACGVSDLCVITSPTTHPHFHAVLGEQYLGMPVRYAHQETPSWRKKPLGTVQAVVAAAPLLSAPFVVVNADTIYGLEPLDLICQHLREHEDGSACCTAYLLKNCLPGNGSKVNRAKMARDGDGWLTSIQEQYNISTHDIGTTYTGQELTSLNVFGFRPAHLPLLAERLATWLDALQAQIASHPPAPDAKEPEFILADVINTLSGQGLMRLRVLGPTTATPLEITHPEDAEVVRAALVAEAGKA